MPDAYHVGSGQACSAGRWLGGRVRGAATPDEAQALGSIGPGAATVVSGAATQDEVQATGTVAGYVPPAWLSAITSSQWGTLPNSTLSSSGAGWAGTSPGGSGNYQSIVTAWSGGCLNTVGCYYGGQFNAGTFLVLFGGGHSDYGGNEVYAYGPLEADSPAWWRLTDPTITAPNNVNRDGSGKPVSRHTYDALQFLPDTNEMICVGVAGRYSAGSDGVVSDLFKFASNTWAANDSGFPSAVGSGGLLNLRGGYNTSTGKVWGVMIGNSTKAVSWDKTTRVWTEANVNNPNYIGNTKSAIHPGKNILVQYKSGGGLEYLTLASIGTGFATPTVSGTGPSSVAGAVIEWDAANSRFVAWDRSGTAMYFLSVPTDHVAGAWAWTSAPGTGGATPASATTNGTYGRWRVVPSLSGILLMPTATNPICFYKF